ncbi:MAG TPA: nucleoside triphosphate pyrophosphohydrolase [Candidatus Polarisedimenticolaceae bacterium]|nr:nucleoside triphosphate pyrophosphohydrolase [Candidatus Polarisedimenticolaceae bacterium]
MASPRNFDDLVAIMDRLRDPGGCPWDREQTFATLRGFLIEECYEAVEALDRDDLPGLCEELGDLLLQVVFLSRLAREAGAFSAADVVEGISAKMVRRHPHVFGDEQAADSAAVLKRWEEIKKEEKGGGESAASLLDGIPQALPALVKAQRLGAKAARVGFDWERTDGVLEKLREESDELAAAVGAGDPASVREELGDLLFTAAMVARKQGLDADEALSRANAKFRARFAYVEGAARRAGVALADAGPALMDRWWEESKARRPE